MQKADSKAEALLSALPFSAEVVGYMEPQRATKKKRKGMNGRKRKKQKRKEVNRDVTRPSRSYII